MSDKICKDCGTTLEEIVPPQSSYIDGRTFHLPFGLKVTFYQDKSEDGCINCLIEASQEKQRQIYNSGFNDGANKVLESRYD